MIRLDMEKHSTLEIICVGNELLIGKTLNTNENWLAKRATELGFRVTRITTVRDELDDIEKVIREVIERGPRFIITVGGLGPTYDDKTMEGVAAALKMPLILNEEAFEMVKSRYEAYSKERGGAEIELTPARLKMAKMPEKAEPISNPVGTAPGVLVRLEQEGVFLISLPGVPSEMKAIFEKSVEQLMKMDSDQIAFYEEEIRIEGRMESSLAPLIDQAVRENPHVYIKSHPKGEETIPHVEIHLTTMADNPEKARQRLENAIQFFKEILSEL